MYRGSRKHVLDWTDRSSFLTELGELLAPIPIAIPAGAAVMPRGHASPREARLESFGPEWRPANSAWPALKNWWLVHHAGANTPNWDIVVECTVGDKAGLVLVEAKANWPELGRVGKVRDLNASRKSKENHDRICSAVREACANWQAVDGRVNIDAGSHYQLANRLAFVWKLASLGIPVVLLYLGFTNDEGIRDAGEPFADDSDWQRAFEQYANGVFPIELLNRRIEFTGTPVWILCKSRTVLQSSPPIPRPNVLVPAGPEI